MKKIFVLLTILVFFLFPISSMGYFGYTWSTLQLTEEVSSNLSDEKTDDSSNPLNLDCGSCILIEQNTGQILYSYNSHEQLRPASVTKLMSIYLIMEAISNGQVDYDTQIPCSSNAESMGGSQIWLTTSETLSVDEMLKAICVVSANDCVVAMAEYIGGTEENFVNMMNDKAQELGMNDTNYKNCHGIDEDDHYTSSYDIALISRALLNDFPEIMNYTTIYMDSLRDGTSSLVNTNKLVRTYSGCTGLKTGSTSLALYNLSASASRDGLNLIAVVMKAPTSSIRFQVATSLLDYGFSNVEYKQLINSGDVVQSVKISKGLSNSVNALAESSCGAVLTKGNDVNIEQSIFIENELTAPISKGDIIGKITYSLNDENIAECNLIAESDVQKLNLFSMDKYLLSLWMNLLRHE